MFEVGWTLKLKKTVHPRTILLIFFSVISLNSNYPVPPALKAKDND